MNRSAAICQKALVCIQADPLALPEAIEAHLKHCDACAEARVAWLAQEDNAAALAPAGYFDQLPSRILAKLPGRAPASRWHPLLWVSAAGLGLAVATGGFLLGLSRRPPMAEATLAVPVQETYELLPDTPFQEAEDAPEPLSPAPAARPPAQARPSRP